MAMDLALDLDIEIKTGKFAIFFDDGTQFTKRKTAIALGIQDGCVYFIEKDNTKSIQIIPLSRIYRIIVLELLEG